MSDKIKKFLDFDVKAADGEDGTYWFTASTDSRDRQGDVIVQDTWRIADFMKNPVILWAHNYYETPIGKAIEVNLAGGKLSLKIQFVPESIDPFAAKVEKLVANKFLRTGSVGFMVYKSEPLSDADLKQRPEMKYGQRLHGDLLEFSIVPVPANPEALNQNEYTDVVSRGLNLKSQEAQSKFLPYRDQKGNVSPRLLRASLAAALGARGGIDLKDISTEACVNHLYRVASENKIDVPVLSDIQNSGSLKDIFSDVWHDELLDVINNSANASGDVIVKLLKGHTRTQLIAARDALNTILDLKEELPKSESQSDGKGLESMKWLVASLGELNDKLK
jgi:HK97 family phage prohead protease